jgi:hypothetical protein
MPEEIKNTRNRVECLFDGSYCAFWRGSIVYEHQKTGIRRFEIEPDAWEYLARCDLAGKIIY